MRRKVAAYHSSLPKAVPWEAPSSPHRLLTLPEMSVWELTSRYCFGSGKLELSRELLLDHRSECDPLSVRKPSFSMARL